MDLATLARVINREQKSAIVVAGLSEHQSRTPETIRDGLYGLIKGSRTPARMGSRGYRLFQPAAITKACETTISTIVCGDSSTGFRLCKDFDKRPIERAIRYTAKEGISMYDILRTDSAAEGVIELLRSVAENDGLRVIDIEGETGLLRGSINKHLLRLERHGILYFERYPRGVSYRWKNGVRVERVEDVIEDLGAPKSKRRAVTNRAFRIASHLQESQGSAHTVQEVATATCSGSSRGVYQETSSALRLLEEQGLVVPTNDYRGGRNGALRRSKINLRVKGKRFVNFLDEVQAGKDLKPALSDREIRKAIRLYTDAMPVRESREKLKRRILAAVRKKPGMSKIEIETAIKKHSQKSLPTLVDEGTLRIEGKGNSKNPYRYYPK